MYQGLRKPRKVRGDLFDRIGLFLDAQGLSPDPAHYAFAHAVLAEPDGPLAAAVARLTDGGVRLSQRELEELGLSLSAGRPREPATDDPASRHAEALVAETQAQVDGFAQLLTDIQAETRGFGRDLAASTAQIAGENLSDRIARIAGAMVSRARDAERQLARATEETDQLRGKLAEARDAARRDVLTGLPNRLAFDEAFAARGTGACALAICDIDHFKRLNDRHGHALGDRVLHSLARTLEAECAGQLVVRYGGEEFAILIGGLDLEPAAALVDRARAAVSVRRFRDATSGTGIGQVSFSAGVTAITRADDKASAFERADRLLYQAKAEGRDRVIAG
jgi:diguanylate cyclase